MSGGNSHFAHIIKYIGMSFITGAIAHGFFSGKRQILTALFGVLCFVVGTYMEEGKNGDKKMLAYAALLAIGIGALTGGLQHFPDSPERSIWIVPIGFLISVIFYQKVIGKKITSSYTIIGTILALIISLSLYFVIENTTLFGTHTHGHDSAPSIVSSEQSFGKDIEITPSETEEHVH